MIALICVYLSIYNVDLRSSKDFLIQLKKKSCDNEKIICNSFKFMLAVGFTYPLGILWIKITFTCFLLMLLLQKVTLNIH